MTRFNTEAIVIAATPMGESDRLVRMITPGQGRLAAVVKGALRSKTRFAGLFDTCQLINAGFMTAPRSGRLMIEHADLVNGFPALRKSAQRLGRASLLLEMVNLSVAEEETAQGAFNILLSGLSRLNQEPDSDRWAIAYSFRLLAVSGYRPLLDSCSCCSSIKLSRNTIFDATSGGLLCGPCGPEGGQTDRPDILSVSADTVKTLCAIMDAQESMVGRINFTRNSLEQARNLLKAFIAYQLAAPSRVIPFLEKVA